MPTGIVLCEDDDLLRFEPNLDEIWPRTDRKTGNVKRDWLVQRKQASIEIERQLKARKDTAERFELGRCSQRTLDDFRDVAANMALHYIFIAADTQGDAAGFFARKAAHYWSRSGSMLDGAAETIDYDIDNSGTTDDIEKDQPMPVRIIRG